VIRQQNCGVSAARNAGMVEASGEYLAFLDADDVFLPHALESNADYLDTHPNCGAVYADAVYCDRDGNPLAKLSDYWPSDLDANFLDTIVVTPFIAVCAAMVRGHAIDARRLRFEPDRTIGEDWEFFIRLAETEEFGRNSEVVFKYRIHGTNATVASGRQRSASTGRVRLRILDSPLIDRLSLGTRATLFYQLLFENFADDPDTQLGLLTSRPFAELPATEQSRLLHLLAAHWLEKGWSGQKARALLESSTAHCPQAVKPRLLWLATCVSPGLSRSLLGARRRLSALYRKPAESTALQLFEELA
jgi:hypothetical protein